MEALVGLIIGILIAAVISGAIIWLVAKLGMGLSVASFGWAMLAGLIIGILTNLIGQYMSDFGGWQGALVHLVVSAGVIFAAGKLLKGMTVNGIGGALLAAVAIAAINYLIVLLLGNVAGVSA